MEGEIQCPRGESQGAAEIESRDGAEDRLDGNSRDGSRALKDTVTLANQAEQRALSSRQSDGRTIQQLRRRVSSVRQEMAEWAGAEAAKEASNYKRKLGEAHNKLAVALCSVKEAEERKAQLNDRLRAA